MSKKVYISTPWDIVPTSGSDYAIYDVDDQLIMGNAVDNTQKYDGSEFVDLDGDAPKGNIFVIYKDRLMIAGDRDFPHRWWFSHIRNGEGWTKSFDWIDVYPEDGGKINGGVVQNDELITSKSNGRKYGWRIYDDGDPTNSRLRKIEDDKGNVNSKAETVMEDVDYYLDRNALFTVPAGPKGGLTYIVQEVIQAITNFDNVTVGSNDGKVYVSLGNITLDIEEGITIGNAVLVYDTINEMFYIRDNTSAHAFTRFINADGVEDLYFGDSEGRVFKLDDGLLAGTNPLHMVIRTKQYMRESGKMISFSKIGIFSRNPNGTKVSYRVSEQSGWKDLGPVTQEPIQWFEPEEAKGPFIQLQFTHSNQYERPIIEGFELVYNVEGDEK